MSAFSTMQLPIERTVVAPDGSDVRVLLGLAGGGMAHFSLPAEAVSAAVTHRTVEEIWFIIAGSGQMWRRQGSIEAVTELAAGTCVTIPLGTHFQFRAGRACALEAVAITMPPWPGDGEAVPVSGPWRPTAGSAA